MIAYKVMAISEDGTRFTSGANSRLSFPVSSKEILMPGNGLYVSNNRQYVLDYYSGLAEKEALLTLEVEEESILWGNTTDRDAEFSVSKARILSVEILESE